MPLLRWTALAALAVIGGPGSLLTEAFATAPVIPYAERNRAFSAWSTTIRGDLRELGLAGASVALGDTFIGSIDNPASLAMLLDGARIGASANRIQDGAIQSDGAEVRSSNIGLAGAVYPWAFSLGWWIPQHEGQLYRMSPGDRPVLLENKVREYQASLARVFWNNRLSVGASLVFGEAIQTVHQSTQRSNGFGGVVGALYRLKSRWLVGFSYATGMNYAGDPLLTSAAGPDRFFQPILSPRRTALGVGWIPNRFFRFGAALYVIGATPGAALLSDQTRTVGERMSLQPRVGSDYLIAEYREFRLSAGMGSYLEFSRIAGGANRLHLTGALSADIWIFSAGLGFDKAQHYSNFAYFGGIEVMRLARKLDLIPPPAYQPPRAGFLPKPFHISDEGLARPMVRDWKPRPTNPSIIEIGRELPKRIQKRVEEAGEAIRDAVQGAPKRYDEPLAKPTKRPGKKPRPRGGRAAPERSGSAKSAE